MAHDCPPGPWAKNYNHLSIATSLDMAKKSASEAISIDGKFDVFIAGQYTDRVRYPEHHVPIQPRHICE